MRTPVTALTFTSGAVLGLTLALCLGAVQNPKPGLTNQTLIQPVQSSTAAPTDWSRLKFFAYPNGGTGIFDPATGTIYVYDSDLNRCYLVREIRILGEPLRKP